MYTSESSVSLDAMIQAQKAAFQHSPMPDLPTRKATLLRLKKAIQTHQERLVDALMEDFGCGAREESALAEIIPSIQAINYSIKHLKRWMKPSARHVALHFQPAKARVEYQPLGVVGIMVPWNYPVFLALGPLITALAAGNRAMIKLSEFTPATNIALAAMLADVFAEDEVAVVTGETEVAAQFSSLPFDHILFTGSTTVGKLVMKAASANLTPVTLELGGKSPTIIGPDMQTDQIADRLLFGKAINSGQTCIAPDYLLCHEDMVDEVIADLKRSYQHMYPRLSGCQQSTAIINPHHYQRLRQLLHEAQAQGAVVENLGSESLEQLEAERKMPVQIVRNVSDDMRILNEKLFGPILPIVTYREIDEALAYINQRPRPLALYLFSYDKALQRKVLNETHAGGVCINEAVFHAVQDDLPFGGVGASGMGHYHGAEGFRTLSHAKAVYERGRINSAKLIYPPYKNRLLAILARYLSR